MNSLYFRSNMWRSHSEIGWIIFDTVVHGRKKYNTTNALCSCLQPFLKHSCVLCCRENSSFIFCSFVYSPLDSTSMKKYQNEPKLKSLLLSGKNISVFEKILREKSERWRNVEKIILRITKIFFFSVFVQIKVRLGKYIITFKKLKNKILLRIWRRRKVGVVLALYFY